MRTDKGGVEMPHFEGSKVYFHTKGNKVIEINCPVAICYYRM